jgi:long-chain acyl-CoA synthetase
LLLLLLPDLQACNRMSYECVPLYDTLGENAVEFIINHSEAVITIVDGRKLGSLAGAVKGINTAQFKNVVYWGAEDAAAVQVRALAGVHMHEPGQHCAATPRSSRMWCTGAQRT